MIVWLTSVLLLALSSLPSSKGFVPPCELGSCMFKSIPKRSLCRIANLRSRFEGNQREPTPQEVEIMDEMITKLANAKPYELPNAVRTAFRVCSSPRFFLRIAELSDETSSETEKEKLSAFASNLAACLGAIVSNAEENLDERGKDVEFVLKAASEPDSGEFLVPLKPERFEAMKTAMKEMDPYNLDEGFLSTIDAWSNKSFQDGLDGMVSIFQKVLQIYAGLQLLRSRQAQAGEATETLTAAAIFDCLLETNSDNWEAEARKRMYDNGVNKAGLTREIQSAMERNVLSLGSGSMAQRVQAEYLKEMLSRIQSIKE